MKEKWIYSLFILLLTSGITLGQPRMTDSLRVIINLHKGDKEEVDALSYLSNAQTDFDSVNKYARQGLSLARKINYQAGEANCLFVIARFSNDFSEGIQYVLNALKIYEHLKDNTGVASSHLLLQGNYWAAGDYKNALAHAFTGEKIAEANNVKGIFVFPGHRLAPLFLAETGQIYLLKNQLDSALLYTQKSIGQNETFNGVKWNFPVYLLATIQTMQGDYNVALQNYRSAIPLAIQNDFSGDTLQILSGMSTLFKKNRKLDSAVYYGQKVVQSMNPERETKNLLEAVNNLAEIYKLRKEKDSAIKYIELSDNLEDSIFSNAKDREVQSITFNQQLNQQKIEAAQMKYRSNVQLYTLLAGLFVLFLIAGILWRNNLHRRKAYSVLQKQKEETDFQKMKAEQAFEELKSTQAQLIQREKMASLGELTAGIAHEIQNPLNFVNNFSDVNTELIEELKTENSKIKTERNEKIEAELLNDISENEKKINHHGKRADAIVKGMLQHSQSSTGIKEPTNINALADEYFRLAYQGLRVKDKLFNITMKTDYDKSIGNINVIPQDIGRVMLNLYNNAFYAVNEKKALRQVQDMALREQNYEPIVAVSTKKINSIIEIRVADNGNGIPQNIVDKIFQPFFTTKPTGQGTGLGLSLSYDIIKAHNGEMKVVTQNNTDIATTGAEFIILLPINLNH